MRNQKIGFVFFLVIFLFACSLLDSATPATPIPTVSETDILTGQETKQAVSTSQTPTLAYENSPAKTATTNGLVDIDNSKSETSILSNCPSLLLLNDRPILSKGSILFNGDKPGIWAIPAHSSTPVLVYEPTSWAVLSDDGKKILYFEQKEVGSEVGSVEGYSIIYDLINKDEVTTLRQADWYDLWDWLPEGQIKYLISLERNLNEGEKRKYALVDLNTEQVQIFEDVIDLPGYQYFEEPFYVGLASTDPKERFVLYSSSNDQGGTSVVLKDRFSGAIIWQHDGIGETPANVFPKPKWSNDGAQVLFSMPVSETVGEFDRIFRLTTDGDVEPLPAQPYPLLDENWPIGHLEPSPNDKYIHYSVWQSNWMGPGFIIDTINDTIAEICAPKSTFVNGRWISEEQFVYVMQLENGKQSLRILDTQTWRTQVLIETISDKEIAIFGWTPVEFSE